MITLTGFLVVNGVSIESCAAQFGTRAEEFVKISKHATRSLVLAGCTKVEAVVECDEVLAKRILKRMKRGARGSALGNVLLIVRAQEWIGTWTNADTD